MDGDLADRESNRELPRLLALAWSLNKKEEKERSKVWRMERGGGGGGGRRKRRGRGAGAGARSMMSRRRRRKEEVVVEEEDEDEEGGGRKAIEVAEEQPKGRCEGREGG